MADLEQVRRADPSAAGRPRRTLVRRYLAAAYIAQYPERVERAVFLSPGDLDEDGVGGRPQDRLASAQRRQVYRLLLHPRALLAYALVQVDPEAAHAFAGDAEPAPVRTASTTRPALHCPGRTGPELHGLGFYASQVPQSAHRPPAPDVRAGVDGSRVPALVLRGQCDYLDRSAATSYLEAFEGSRLVHLRGAGHDLHVDAPRRVLAVVRAFLARRP